MSAQDSAQPAPDRHFLDQPDLSSLAQTLALSASVIVAYFWLSLPVLAQYSLQAFALCILLYFILKRANQAKIWQILPTTAVDEMVLVTFAFFILVGATDGTTSIFFPLMFVYLFFVSMTMNLMTSIIMTLETTLFFYALNPHLQQLNLSHLISLPVVMTFFLFAKYQYEQAKRNQNLVEIERNEINSYQIFLQHKESELNSLRQNSSQTSQYFVSFIQNYLQPKLDQISNMLDFSQNRQTIKGQLSLIKVQLEKIADQLSSRVDQEPPA
jgi:hypothetical protein